MKNSILYYIGRIWRESKRRSKILVIASVTALVVLSAAILFMSGLGEAGFVAALWLATVLGYSLVLLLRVRELKSEEEGEDRDGE
jgi:hypothetical protein